MVDGLGSSRALGFYDRTSARLISGWHDAGTVSFTSALTCRDFKG